MIKLYDYGDGYKEPKKSDRHDIRERAFSGFWLSVIGVTFALAIFFLCLAVIVLYMRFNP